MHVTVTKLLETFSRCNQIFSVVLCRTKEIIISCQLKKLKMDTKAEAALHRRFYPQAQRGGVMKSFRGRQIHAIATDVAARGIDVSIILLT